MSNKAEASQGPGAAGIVVGEVATTALSAARLLEKLVVEDNDQAEDRHRAEEPGGRLVPGLHFVRNVQMHAPSRKGEAPVWARVIRSDVT